MESIQDAERKKIQDLPVLSVTFELEVQDELRLSAFPGSAIRGVLGHALREVACSRNPSACRSDDGLPSCPYHYLFDTSAPLHLGENRGAPEVPRPFVLQLPRGGQTLKPGQCFRLGLRLFGRASRHLAQVLYGIEEMGRRGLGRDRARFQLVRALSGGTVFYEGRGAQIGEFLWEPSSVPLRAVAPQVVERNRSIAVQFLSPTRLKFRGELVRWPEFHVLIRALVRRLDLLCQLHGGFIPQDLDPQGLIRVAAACCLDTCEVRWLDWERQSQRQQRRIPQGGFVGKVSYRGDFAPLLPMLKAGAVTHVGKGTTFGLGHYRLLE